MVLSIDTFPSGGDWICDPWMGGWEIKWFLVSPENDGPGDATGGQSRIIRIVPAWSSRVVSLLSVWWQCTLYVWGLKLGTVSPEPGIGLEWPGSCPLCPRFVPNLGLCCFLRGESWKFQAPAVTHVSISPIACPLKSARPRPGTVFFGGSLFWKDSS